MTETDLSAMVWRCARDMLHRHITRARLRLIGTLVLAGIAGSACARSIDPISALIERQTNVSSEAGQKGDQATVDRMTADEILFSAGDGAIQRDEKFDVADSTSEDLKKSTALRYLSDPALQRRQTTPTATLFVDETGALSPTRDFEGGAASISDWILHRKDNVAVSSFTVESGAGRFLAVEIWTRQKKGWTLVGGQTIPLHADPLVVAIPRDRLNDYTGNYSAGPGSVVLIEVAGDGLTSAQPKSQPRTLKPTAPDVFFSPDLPLGYLRALTTFKRSEDGQVQSFSRNGIVFRKVSDGAVSAAQDPVSGPLTIRDFQVLHLGNLAIAAFFHDRDTDYYGQTLHQTFRSMEAWINEGGNWKMISSQGCQL